jgi:hypothetical protein
MGGTECIRTYNGKLTRKQLEQQIENDRQQDGMEDGWSYSGSFSVKDGHKYENKTFASTNIAYEWICENNDKWGPLSIVNVVEKQGTETQNKRIDIQRQKVRDIERELTKYGVNWLSKLYSQKSLTKSCPKCKTRFQKNQIKRTSCSCCGTSFYSETDKKRVKKIEEKISKEQQKLDLLISKKGGKTNKYWMAGGICSC